MDTPDLDTILTDPDTAMRGLDAPALVACCRSLAGEIERIGGFERPTQAQSARFDAAVAAFELADQLHARSQVDAARERSESWAALVGAARGQGDARIERGGAFDGQAGRPARAGVRGEGLRAIDTTARAGYMSAETAETLTGLVEHGEPRERAAVARWAAVTGTPEYTRAFLKTYADPERGHLTWSDAEREAFAAVQEFRAMSTTDTAGGYLIPAHLDPAIILTNTGVRSSLRSIARVETITSDVWNGVTSAGVTASWYAEAAEVTDDSPTLAAPAVPVYRYSAFVPVSFEAFQDAPAIAQQVALLLADSADRLQTTAFTTGSGSGQPTGIVTALTGTGSVVASTTADTFAAGDLTKTQNALPPRWQPGASWAMGLATLNTAAAFVSGSVLQFPGLSQNPPSLLNRPVTELSTMDTTYGSGENYISIYGDFKQFLIVDRVGTTIEFIPQLFGANRRPTGQRGWMMWGRVGSDVLVDDSFRMLNIT